MAWEVDCLGHTQRRTLLDVFDVVDFSLMEKKVGLEFLKSNFGLTAGLSEDIMTRFWTAKRIVTFVFLLLSFH